MRIEEVRRLIRLVEESDIGELDVWKWWGRVRIRKTSSQNGEVITVTGGMRTKNPLPAPEAAPELPSPAPTPAPETEAEEAGLVTVNSPMVGTFYRAPAPDASPYVQVGQTVEPGQTVCIIEAMKLMNEIQSEVRGKITRILVDNAQPVEFGQTLFLVKEE
jgi:acetyl-CoA carboxylase biotin carboxyl carrier protein